MESRVLVTARRMTELGLAPAGVSITTPAVIEAAPRPLTALELIDALDADLERDGQTRPTLLDPLLNPLLDAEIQTTRRPQAG
jgi:hypothetical protein